MGPNRTIGRSGPFVWPARFAGLIPCYLFYLGLFETLTDTENSFSLCVQDYAYGGQKLRAYQRNDDSFEQFFCDLIVICHSWLLTLLLVCKRFARNQSDTFIDQSLCLRNYITLTRLCIHPYEIHCKTMSATPNFVATRIFHKRSSNKKNITPT